MTIPTYEQLMLPLLEAYAHAEGPISIKELLPIIADRLQLSDEELAERLPSGRQGLFANRVHWAKTYMNKAGLVESPSRGLAVITERGRNILASKPEYIDGAMLAEFDEFKEWTDASKPEGSSAPVTVDTTAKTVESEEQNTPVERIESARMELEAVIKEELLERIRSMSPAEFEELIVQLLLRMGYGVGAEEMAKSIGGTNDGGLDGVIHQDPLGLDRVYIQAKRYREGNNVGSGDIRDFNGALDLVRAPKGLFVTASSFTSSAAEQAKSATRQIVLIDGKHLTSLMIRYKIGVRVLGAVDIIDIDEGFFAL